MNIDQKLDALEHAARVFFPQGATSPKLSIITICKDDDFLEDTCRSILAQTFQEFEWVVVDGASGPRCQEVLTRYRSRMDVLFSEPDTGRYQAMNKGILQAHGEYLLFLHAGDALFQPRTLEHIFRYTPCAAIPAPDLQADILYGEIIAHETGMLPWPLWNVGPRTWDAHAFMLGSLPHQATFIRRELFLRYGYYDEQLQSAGDLEWFLRCILLHQASYAYLPAIVSRFRFDGISSGSSTSIAERKLVEERYAFLLRT